MGYTAHDATCDGTAADVDYIFTKMIKQWVHNSIVFNAGLNDTAESDNVEPFTYKLRGAYFDGVGKLLTLDNTTGFNLHSLLTFQSWFYPTVSNGTLFSKSHADWTSTNTSGFLSIAMAPAGIVSFVANLNSNVATSIPNAYTLNNWNHLGLIVTYDKSTTTTTITPVVFGVA
jgi:hypothetical protein